MVRRYGWKSFSIALLTCGILSTSLAEIVRGQSVLESIIKTIFGGEPKDRRGGSNGGGKPIVNNACLLTPQPLAVVWNDRPLFVWSGGSTSIGVRENDKVIWRKSVAFSSDTVQQVQYDGPALRPGKTYEWAFFFDQSATSPQWSVEFQVATAAKRSRMTSDLEQLTAKLKAEGATDEALALKRAQYFANHKESKDRKFGADAIQELFSIKQPSVELQQARKQIVQNFCN